MSKIMKRKLGIKKQQGSFSIEAAVVCLMLLCLAALFVGTTALDDMGTIIAAIDAKLVLITPVP